MLLDINKNDYLINIDLIEGYINSNTKAFMLAHLSGDAVNMHSMKALAKELDVPIVALSQLSRAVEQRSGSHRPQLSDLRESGAIEQDADVVIFLYRKYLYTKEEEDDGKAEIIVAKQRNGPTNTVEAAFINRYTRFENLAHNSEPPF